MTLFIDCNNYLQSETRLKPRDDVACDVMSTLSDPHQMKFATYALLPVKFLQRAPITACIIRPTNCFSATIVCFSLSFASFFRRCFLGGLSTALIVCLREILLDKKNQNMAQIQGGHCPWSKIQGGQPTTLTPPCRAPGDRSALLYRPTVTLRRQHMV